MLGSPIGHSKDRAFGSLRALRTDIVSSVDWQRPNEWARKRECRLQTGGQEKEKSKAAALFDTGV